MFRVLVLLVLVSLGLAAVKKGLTAILKEF